jgi:RNAse (barnase) inhibitor barstar
VNTIENKSIFYRLYDILQQYDLAFTNMLNLDRFNDACEIILTRSIPIWKSFARDTNNENEQKKYFSQALRLLEQLTEILAERWQKIRMITSQNDVRKYSLTSK